MSANPGQGIENEYSQEILFRPLREIDRTFNRSVPVTNLSKLFSIEAVSVTGFFCTTMLSSDVTETRSYMLLSKRSVFCHAKEKYKEAGVCDFYI